MKKTDKIKLPKKVATMIRDVARGIEEDFEDEKDFSLVEFVTDTDDFADAEDEGYSIYHWFSGYVEGISSVLGVEVEDVLAAAGVDVEPSDDEDEGDEDEDEDEDDEDEDDE